MDIVPVLTKKQLINANNWAIQVGYNRALEPEPLQAYLDTIEEDIQFPITFSMPHHHAAGKEVEEHVRCQIILNGTGDKAMLDLDLDFFNILNRVEVPDESSE
jgi:lysozyme family protein